MLERRTSMFPVLDTNLYYLPEQSDWEDPFWQSQAVLSLLHGWPLHSSSQASFERMIQVFKMAFNQNDVGVPKL